MTLPVIIGMNNPQGSKPLWPDPPGCAGWRLWQLSGMERKEWLRAFRRVNILDTPHWDREAARVSGPEIWSSYGGRRIILLGHGAREAVGLPPVPWIVLQVDERTGTTWRFLPHPSGRCQLYNDPVMREAVRMVLQEMSNGHP